VSSGVVMMRAAQGDQEHLPGGRLFRLRRVTWKSTPSNQRCLLLVGPLLRRGSFTPVSLRGPAPNGHPCPDGALAASLRLGPLRETCVQPAPKSRLASSGRLAYEDQDQKQIKSFPAEAGPTDGCAGFYWLNALLLVGPALAGKRPVWAMGLFRADTRTLDRAHAPRGNASPDAPRHMAARTHRQFIAPIFDVC